MVNSFSMLLRVILFPGYYVNFLFQVIPGNFLFQVITVIFFFFFRLLRVHTTRRFAFGTWLQGGPCAPSPTTRRACARWPSIPRCTCSPREGRTMWSSGSVLRASLCRFVLFIASLCRFVLFIASLCYLLQDCVIYCRIVLFMQVCVIYCKFVLFIAGLCYLLQDCVIYCRFVLFIASLCRSELISAWMRCVKALGVVKSW